MPSFEDVLSAARLLSSADRILLAEAIWQDVAPDEWPPPAPEWVAEVQRRSAEFDAGRAAAAPWSEVKSRARRAVGDG